MNFENLTPVSGKKDGSKAEVVPSEFHLPGLGGSSFSPDGYSQLLISAIAQAKETASKCAEDPELQKEYEIFNKKAVALEEELNNYLGDNARSQE